MCWIESKNSVHTLSILFLSKYFLFSPLSLVLPPSFPFLQFFSLSLDSSLARFLLPPILLLPFFLTISFFHSFFLSLTLSWPHSFIVQRLLLFTSLLFSSVLLNTYSLASIQQHLPSASIEFSLLPLSILDSSIQQYSDTNRIVT